MRNRDAGRITADQLRLRQIYGMNLPAGSYYVLQPVTPNEISNKGYEFHDLTPGVSGFNVTLGPLPPHQDRTTQSNEPLISDEGEKLASEFETYLAGEADKIALLSAEVEQKNDAIDLDGIAILRETQGEMDEALLEGEIAVEDAKLFLASRGIAFPRS